MAQEPGIGFWISVSGTDDKENFPYFIESNFRIEGRTEARIRLLMSEWRHGFDLTVQGGAFEAYLAATTTVRHDPFMALLSGSPDPSRVATPRRVSPSRPSRTATTTSTSPKPADILTRYTDGVTEAFDDTGEEFGRARDVAVIAGRRRSAATAH